MNTPLLAGIIFAGAFCLSSAAGPQGPDAAKAELLALHRADRRAHFQHDVDALLATVPPEFIFVRDGKVQPQSREDLRARFTHYFQGTEFTTWDDLEPPIVHVSPDGQMGWMVVRVKIALDQTDASGKRATDTTVMAWMSVYEKHDGKWQHVANATTVQP
jgi:ketosteroid isomerase-like protein